MCNSAQSKTMSTMQYIFYIVLAHSMLQNLMNPLVFNQSGLDPFSVGSVSSMSSPTTTLSPDIYGVATNSSWYSYKRRTPPTRPKRHSSRPSMDIVAKFGQMGSGLGQFHSPHGFCWLLFSTNCKFFVITFF
uniref:Uncharacterized protein n=1 Tax=Schizaphis graminum TaxID=13262 RepID=A0A2S2PS63_SCHGA